MLLPGAGVADAVRPNGPATTTKGGAPPAAAANSTMATGAAANSSGGGGGPPANSGGAPAPPPTTAATFRAARNKAPVYTSDKRAKFTQRENKKWIRLATVFGYIVSVSFPAIVLSIYYTFFWNPDYASKFTANDTQSGDTLATRVDRMRATLAPVIEAEAEHEAMVRKAGAGAQATEQAPQQAAGAPPMRNTDVHKQVCAATCERMCNRRGDDLANHDFSRKVRHLGELLQAKAETAGGGG